MRESKWRKRRKRIQQNPPKKLVVEGVFGRCDMPSGPRVYSRSIMVRELQRLCIKIRKRRKRGLTDQDPSGVYEDAMNQVYDEKYARRHDDGLLALAEASTPPEEVLALIEPLMAREFHRAKKTHMRVGRARDAMELVVERFLNRSFYVLPQKKRIIDKISKRHLKGYQKWYRRVEAEEKQISRRLEKNGKNGSPLAEALRLVSPELFEDE